MAKAAAFKEALEKTAASFEITNFLKYLAAGLGASIGLGLTAAGAQAGLKAYERYKITQDQESLFKEVLRIHPDLAANKERAKLYFVALIHFSPVVAQNPLTAGAYIKQALQYDHVAGGPLPQSINELTQIQRQVTEAHKNAPKSTLGTVLSGVTEAPVKALPSFLTYSQFTE